MEKSKLPGRAPSRLSHGIKNPPRQQSTWKPMRRAAQRAAISSMGSIVPCGNAGAEPTAITVLALRARAKAAMSALKVASTGTMTSLTPSRWAPLLRAGCAVAGMTISGAVMPKSAAARSR
eukprot:Amastigsp_a514539_140.p5 type:complete len:121 gc:universal Amastigsp_a514539_140:667-1029(+)